MDTADHQKFFEILLGPSSLRENTRYLDASQARKLACVSKKLQHIVPAAELENNKRWKENGENVFGMVFTKVCEICTQAGYNPLTMPGFYMNINTILSTNYMEEIELDTPEATGQLPNVVRGITGSMLALTVGRSRKSDFACLGDPNVSRTQAIIHKHTGKLVYRNLSGTVDGWRQVGNETPFVMMPRKTSTGPPSETILQIGDYVIVSGSNISTLRVNLSERDVARLLHLMHLTKCRDDPNHGPDTLEEARCTLELARARQHRGNHDTFFEQRLDMTEKDSFAFEHRLREQNKQKLAAKIVIMDENVHRLEVKLMTMHKHQKVLKDLGQKDAQRPHQTLERHREAHKVTDERESELMQEIEEQRLLLQEQTRKLELLEAQTQCVICFHTRSSNYAFQPCGHVCCCETCAHVMLGDKCPMCRVRVNVVTRVYL